MDKLSGILEEMLGTAPGAASWLSMPRLSARELSDKTKVGRIYAQREALKLRSLPKLAANHHKSIFYFLDLEKTSDEYRKSGLELPVELSSGEPVIKRIQDTGQSGAFGTL